MIELETSVILPVLPLRNSVLFPGQMMPLVAGRPSSIAAVEAALATEDKTLVIGSQKDSSIEEPKLANLFQIGTLAIVKRMDRGPGGVQIMVHGTDRVELVEVEQETPFLRIEVKPIPRPDDSSAEVEALQQAMLEMAGKVAVLMNPQAQIGLMTAIAQIADPLDQAYMLGAMLPLDMDKEQALLAAKAREEGLRLMHEYLAHELLVLELRQKIASQAESELSREQRQYLLRQQLRAIQKELDEENPEQADLVDLREKLKQAQLPDSAQSEVERELGRLERLPSASPDYQVTRTHLELVAELPWNQRTEDILDLPRARQVLDEDHHDLEDIKKRIVGQLAVLKLNPDAKAPILCFVGPPGVGKTSLGQSIARALGRKFERMSLGGLHDEAELRGHRRTYIGAMPGRIIQAIRRAGVNNPLLMLDEVDKLGHDYRGDPAAALMEILDPAQNAEFRDNYLDLPFDLSRVFFITTANFSDAIPQALLDRMEVLRLSGYSDEQKGHIARRYLIPRQLRETGLTAEQLVVPDDTLQQITRRYTREAGVRQLERTLGSLCRKVAVRFAEGEKDPVVVQPDDLATLLGPEHFFEEDIRRELAPGVTPGLAWTQAGGEVIYVEAVLLPDSGDLILTGHLGDVMKESARAAQSYIRAHATDLGIAPAKGSGVHIHVPAGATPKDGPSAGVTMVTALASVYSGKPVRSDTAMTGEITLSGLVLPVGGIKEKVLAAHRAGIRRVALPTQNRQDLVDVPEHVQAEMEFIFLTHIDDVLHAAIPEL